MNPRPPESTTPAAARAGSSSGVRSTDSRAAATARSSTPAERVTLGGVGDGLRRLAHDGQDRPFHRSEHRLVRGVGRAAQGPGQVDALDVIERVELVGEAPQDLRGDDAGIAAGTHQRPAADRVADLFHGLRGRELGAHRLQRQRHVGAGVAVRNGVDVEPVQLFLVRAQRVAVAQHRPAQIGSRQAGEGRHRAGDYSGASLSRFQDLPFW